MKTLRRLGALVLCLAVLAALVPADAAPAKTLTVLFTHDTHDHFYPDAADVGGYTRLSTLLKERRAQAQAEGIPVLTLDGGDFSMGSLFQTAYASDAVELRALGAMGYDVTTLGNHEFDYRPQGLACMLTNAKASGEVLPAIVQANYKTPVDPSDAGAQAAVAALENYPVTDYVVVERGGLRVAVFGVMGVDSDECAPMSGMTLEPLADAAKRVVADIQARENPDFIICLSHAGTENRKGEDVELARKVSGIDLIISGHSHATLEEPILVGDTAIVSCGPYTENLGQATLTKNGDKAALAGYSLTPIDGSIPPDPAMERLIEGFKEKVAQGYLSDYGLEFDGVLTQAVNDFTIPQTGDFIGRAYIETVRQSEGETYVPIAFAVAPDGVIRGAIRKGEITTADAFEILSLGVGADGTPGYPLISLYLTGKDLKNAFEVDASISAIMPAAALYGAGSWWRVNPNRMFLDRVAQCQLASPEGDGAGTIDDNKLYRVVADLYSGQMLSAVKAKSFGLLSITPRDAQGNPMEDFERLILHDQSGREIKAWYALAGYLSQQETVAPVAASKTVTPSWAPGELLCNAGWPTAAVGVVLLVVLVLVVLLVLRLTRRKKEGYRPYQGRKGRH